MDMRRSSMNEAAAEEVPMTVSAGRGVLGKVLAVVLILAALTLTGYFLSRVLGSATADSAVKGKQLQAVFLTNGQVYFGKVSHVDSSYVKLTNIYYLQVTNGQQQAVQPKDQNQQPQVSLAKLGGELHGPEDVMYISRQQVLFWENLKEDGKVAKAVKDYQAQGNK